MEDKIENLRDCEGCKGTGISDHVWNGKEFTKGECRYCKGTGKFEKPNISEIINLITKTTKKGVCSFRVAKPKFENEFRNQNEGRAYFVWRMVRFHGGEDVTMPVNAGLCVHKDPYFNELNTLSEMLAKKFFGTDMAAAYRWKNALGGSVSVPSGLPASAYPCGPVVLSEKPEEESQELI